MIYKWVLNSIRPNDYDRMSYERFIKNKIKYFI